MISYEFISDEQLSTNKIAKIEVQIKKSISFLDKNLDRFLSYLHKEKELGNYIEIDMPIFESNLSIKINLFYEKILISVMNHKDSEFFGSLIIEGYDCLDKESIEKIGTLTNPIHNFKKYTHS